MNKYIFEIDHAGEFGTVKFTIRADNMERAKIFAVKLNPSARLIETTSDEVFPTEFTGKLLY